MRDRRGWVYQDGAEGAPYVVYRASSIGGCIRGLVAARQGIPASPRPTQIQEKMDESTRAEKVAIDDLRDNHGYEVASQQREVDFRPIEGVSWVVRGHIDGVAVIDNVGHVLEVKNLSENSWSTYHRRGMKALGQMGEKWLWQISSYMLATDMPAVLAVRNKSTGEFSIEVFTAPPVQGWEIRDRIAAVEFQFAQDELPECDRGCTSYDDYWQVHDKPTVEEGDEELKGKLTRFLNLRETRDEIDAQMKELSEELKAEFKPGRYRAGEMKMNISRVRSNRSDTGWIRREHPDVYEASLRPSESVRLTVEREVNERAAGSTE